VCTSGPFKKRQKGTGIKSEVTVRKEKDKSIKLKKLNHKKIN
jgi:hypothetical protein